jgi:hypothetical protein
MMTSEAAAFIGRKQRVPMLEGLMDAARNLEEASKVFREELSKADDFCTRMEGLVKELNAARITVEGETFALPRGVRPTKDKDKEARDGGTAGTTAA